jgi:hypothetical protein
MHKPLEHAQAAHAEAQRVLDGLDDDLARSSQKLGKVLSWTATKQEVRRMIAATIDRRVDVAAAYAACDRRDAPARVIRL